MRSPLPNSPRSRPTPFRAGRTAGGLAIASVALLAVLIALYLWLRPTAGSEAATDLGPALPQVGSSTALGSLQGGPDSGLGTSPIESASLRVGASPGVRLAGDGVLEGRVVDVDTGQGIGGVTVDLLALPPLVGVEVSRFLQLGSFRGDIQRRTAPIATTVSSSDGGFAFAGVRRGRYFLNAHGDFHVPLAPVTARVVPSGAGGPVEVPVRAGGAVAGVVLDGDGRPVPGAEVAIYQGITSIVDALRRGDATLVQGRTDRSGRFQLVGVPPGAGYDLSGWGAQMALSHTLDISVRAGETTEVELRAREGGKVRGVVVGESEEGSELALPIAGALVGAVPRGLRDLTFVASVLERTASKTGADGSFTLGGVPPGEVDVVAWAPGHLPLHRAGVAVAPGGSADVGELRLGTGPILRGRVVDTAGQPIPDVRLRWDMVDWRSLDLDFSFAPFLYQALDEFLFPTTDADGRFEAGPFAGRPAYELWLLATGFGWERYRWDPAREAGEVEIVLTRGGAVEGIVIDSERAKPVTSFTIESSLRVEEAFDAPSPLNPFSGGAEVEHPEGRFRLDGLLPGPRSIVVSAEGYRAERISDLAIVEGETLKGVIVKLKPGLSLTGTVVDAQGQPVGGAVVVPFDDRGRALSGPRREALEDTPLEFLDELRRRAPVDIATGLGVFASGSDLTDAAGRFELTGLAPGTVEVTAVHRDHAPSSAELVVLVEGEEAPDLTLELRLGSTIEGRVTDLRGGPVPGAVVLAARAPNRGSGGRTGVYQSTTDAGGDYRMDNVVAGSYFVALTRGDEALDPMSFLSSLGFDLVTVPTEGTVRLDLVDRSAAATRVYGVVRGGGQAVSGGGLLAFDFDGDNLLGLDVKITRVGADGAYEFPGLAPGTYRFLYQSGRNESALEVEVPELPEVRLDVDLPSGRIEGKVVDARTGDPLERFEVTARRERSSQGQGLLGGLLARQSSDENDYTDAEGAFAFDDLEPGTWTLVARPSRWTRPSGSFAPSEPLVVELGDGRTESGLRIELDAGASLEGWVVDEYGAPVPGADVTVVPRGDGSFDLRVTETDAQGRFTLSGLAAGLVDLVAEVADLAPARLENVTVGPEPTGRIEIVVTRGTELRVRALVDGAPAPGAVGRVERVGSNPAERQRVAESLFRGVVDGRGVAGTDGVLDFGRVAPGRYRVEVSRGSLRAVLEEFEVDGPQPLLLRVDLR
ncbi:carboxypeptidase regulatory-like domain-containing protein [Engelhardtia mirabilis]|uniref:Nickel uptake substrate-specific transmembrane region n=1 Tax=Engelhardtia mirabilis TaxID=2528011 RepID=A0A518BIX3_9BACT|nr:Nickel uptake substrate-specific transmembrane region [Planctomycetes bacterium Pla133]QDV01232.1 Nickel uptake substrate-specific transmembrane region [Planctomycetes bacterium Pla86]